MISYRMLIEKKQWKFLGSTPVPLHITKPQLKSEHNIKILFVRLLV